MSGHTLRGQGTLRQYQAVHWLQKANYAYNGRTEWDAEDFVRRAGFVALTGQSMSRHSNREWALRRVLTDDGKIPPLHSVTQVISRLEDLAEAEGLAYIARRNAVGMRLFSRRMWPNEDAHVGIHIGTNQWEGMPKNAYSAITFQQRWVDVNYSPLHRWLNKLKPLAEMMQKLSHNRQARSQIVSYKESLEQHKKALDELQKNKVAWEAEEAAVLEWWSNMPAITETASRRSWYMNADTKDKRQLRNLIYHLLGRNPWAYQVEQYQEQITRFESLIQNGEPQPDFINQEALTEAWDEAVNAFADWAIGAEGGEEE